MRKRRLLIAALVSAGLWAFPGSALAQAAASFPQIPLLTVNPQNPQEVATGLQIVALLTVLTLAPAILMMMTSFTRTVIVLGLMRQALGTQQSPPNQVVVGLALFLTMFTMAPVGTRIHKEALNPYFEEQIDYVTALNRAAVPVRKFMLRQTREKDLALFIRLSGSEQPKNISDVALTTIIPAFLISELKTAFQVGFMLFIPFLIIDMVVASVLLSLGMMMLPPILVSLPFKLMLFVMVDGWSLLVSSLMQSFV